MRSKRAAIRAGKGLSVPSVSTQLSEIPFGRVGGEEIPLGRALRALKLYFADKRRLPADWAHVAVERIGIARVAARLGMEPSADDTKAAVLSFRQENGLYAAVDVEAYLEERRCTVSDLFQAM